MLRMMSQAEDIDLPQGCMMLVKASTQLADAGTLFWSWALS